MIKPQPLNIFWQIQTAIQIPSQRDGSVSGKFSINDKPDGWKTQLLNNLWPDENGTFLAAAFELKAPAQFPRSVPPDSTWWTAATGLTECVSCRNLYSFVTCQDVRCQGNNLFHSPVATSPSLSKLMTPHSAANNFQLNCTLSAPSTAGQVLHHISCV